MSQVDCRILGPGDAALLSRVAAGVFDRPVVLEWAEALLSEPSHLLVVALDRGEVVGATLSVVSRHIDKPTELWINEVGVADDRHREGIGRALMRATLDEARRRGCCEAWVASDPGPMPLGFYRALGGREEGGQVHFSWPLG